MQEERKGEGGFPPSSFPFRLFYNETRGKEAFKP